MAGVKISPPPLIGLPTGAALSGAELIPMDQTVGGITTTIKSSAAAIAALASISFAAPTALVGLTAIPGAASTAMRSDAAPALNLTISPAWTGNHVFNPASGQPVQINSGGQNLLLTGNGFTGAQYLFGINTGTSALTISRADTAHDIMDLTAVGGVIVNAPTSGVAFTATGVSSGISARFTDAATYGVDIQHRSAGTGPFINADTANTLSLGVGGAEFLQINSGGLASFLGTTLGSGIASTTQIFISGADSASFGWCTSANSTDNKIFDSFVDGAATLHFRAVNDAYTAATDWATIVRSGTAIVGVTLGGGGNGSTYTLAVGSSNTGIFTAGAALFSGGTTTGRSNGVRIIAGTNTADSNLLITNGAQTVNYWNFAGDGSITSSGNGSEGIGTINCAGLFINGAAVTPGTTITTAVAAATETRTSTVAQSNSTQLTLAIAAAGKYAVKLVASFTSGTGAGVAVGLNYSGTFTAAASNVGYFSAPSTAGAAGGDGNQFDSAPAARLSVAGINAAPTAAVFTAEGTLTVTGAGSISMSFAQQSSSANVTTLLIGSYLQIIKIA